MGRSAELRLAFAALAAIAALAGCGGAPRAPDPPLRAQAFAAEGEAAKRFARGEYPAAAQRFAAAERLFAAIDDADGMQRNRNHRARSALHDGQPAAALELLPPAAGNVETLVLQTQALLALGRVDAAASALAAADAACTASCLAAPGLQLLRARIALAQGRPAEAAAAARGALARIEDAPDLRAEAGNAHRLLAESLNAQAQQTAAEAEAMHALAIDRELALPEKIARDWLLIGTIRAAAGAPATAAAAYRQARAVAAAAGLSAMTIAAEAALAKETPK